MCTQFIYQPYSVTQPKGFTDDTIKDVKFISFLTEFQARLVSLSEFIEDYLSGSEKDFEEHCADLYKKQGYTVTVTQKTRDGGYDLLLSKQEDRFGETYTYRAIVECKNYSDTKICDSLVKKLVGANAEVKADKCIFITTSTFTEPAKVYAANVGVQLIDGKALQEMEERVNKS